MSGTWSEGLQEALAGPEGYLMAWLNLRHENEIRAAILALGSPQETLRDKFAAKAMGGTISNNPFRNREELSTWAYKVADAMLKAREAKP